MRIYYLAQTRFNICYLAQTRSPVLAKVPAIALNIKSSLKRTKRLQNQV